MTEQEIKDKLNEEICRVGTIKLRQLHGHDFAVLAEIFANLGAAVSASPQPTDEQYLKLAQGLTNLYICNDRLTPALQDKRTADFLRREMAPFFTPSPAQEPPQKGDKP